MMTTTTKKRQETANFVSDAPLLRYLCTTFTFFFCILFYIWFEFYFLFCAEICIRLSWTAAVWCWNIWQVICVCFKLMYGSLQWNIFFMSFCYFGMWSVLYVQRPLLIWWTHVLYFFISIKIPMSDIHLLKYFFASWWGEPIYFYVFFSFSLFLI